VISLKSGHLFEKRLITKYIETEGKCPITGQELSLADVMDVATNKAVKPRPMQATSVPGMLTLFQNEWDAVMLETYTLKQHLEAVRQELSHALYHDAACRVIARLLRSVMQRARCSRMPSPSSPMRHASVAARRHRQRQTLWRWTARRRV